MKHHSKNTKVTGSLNKQKSPCPGVMPGSGDTSSQMNPRRQRTEDYTPDIQPRESGVRY